MKILIVEDRREISVFLRKALIQNSFSIDVANDGEKGSYLARTNEYDLVILDNILTKRTALQVCREIRERGKTVPILVMSVKQEPSTKVELLDAGADDYISQPFSLDELLAMIRALLRRPRQL